MTKVLLIEDDPLIYRLYKKLFKLEGFELELAKNGQLGLERLSTYTPDIILLDIMMPTMNGLELIAKLKADEETKDIPVVVLTNVSDMNVAQIAISRGAALCLIKSQTEPSEVIASINGVLKKQAEATTEPAKSEE
ncbi:MAG: response regulator [Candidatus Saccharimonadales bacterium]